MSSCVCRRGFLKTVASTGVFMVLGEDCIVAQPKLSSPRPVVGDVNYQYRTVALERLVRLQQDFTRILASGEPSENVVFRGYIDGFDYAPPNDFPDARSVIVVALEDWITEIDFRLNGDVHRVVIPPGYVRTGPTTDELKNIIATDVAGRQDARLELAALPYKLLAARSGLAAYGKNNISFVPGFGTFHSLWAFYSDHAFENNSWSRVTTIPDCRGCRICIDACPTAAISEDRFVIDVGRCVTLYNERPDQIPDWIDPAGHNALVGCTKCQFTCPANEAVTKKRELLAEITEEETRLLLTGASDPHLDQSIANKLSRCGLVGDLKHLGRNLKLALEAAGIAVG